MSFPVVGYFEFEFSRKLENHAAATALNYFAYNSVKIHRTLRTAAGVTDRLWSAEDLVALWGAYERRGKSGVNSYAKRMRLVVARSFGPFLSDRLPPMVDVSSDPRGICLLSAAASE
jgi:hypothetical protein